MCVSLFVECGRMLNSGRRNLLLLWILTQISHLAKPFLIVLSDYVCCNHATIIPVIAPKFEELSEKYTDAVFLKVMGDASPEASKLMKREGVRSVPSFHYFLKGEKVDVINGANADAIEAAITKIANAKSV